MPLTLTINGAACLVFTVPVSKYVVDQRAFGLFEPEPLGRNWIAIIFEKRWQKDKTGRNFLSRSEAHGTYYTLAVKPGSYVEIGADKVRTYTDRVRKRRIVRVLEVTDGSWLVRDATWPPSKADKTSDASDELALFRLIQALEVEGIGVDPTESAIQKVKEQHASA